MPFSNFLANEILDDIFSGNAYSPPGTFYLGLYTAAPTAAGGGTEVSGNSYSRKPTGAFTTTAQQSTNAAAIEFATATGSWGTITHIGIFDAATSGNLLAFAAVTSSKTIGSGDVLRVPASDLDINLA